MGWLEGAQSRAGAVPKWFVMLVKPRWPSIVPCQKPPAGAGTQANSKIEVLTGH
jgi:hypothetical protein